MNKRASPFNKHVNIWTSNSTRSGCIVLRLLMHLQISIARIYWCTTEKCKSVQQPSAASAEQLELLERFFFSVFSLEVSGSHMTVECNQRGHSILLPWLLPDGGLAASESEGSPSKNTSSSIHKMNSFGDAICLSIAQVLRAQVRSSYYNKPFLIRNIWRKGVDVDQFDCYSSMSLSQSGFVRGVHDAAI